MQRALTRQRTHPQHAARAGVYSGGVAVLGVDSLTRVCPRVERDIIAHDSGCASTTFEGAAVRAAARRVTSARMVAVGCDERAGDGSNAAGSLGVDWRTRVPPRVGPGIVA